MSATTEALERELGRHIPLPLSRRLACTCGWHTDDQHAAQALWRRHVAERQADALPTTQRPEEGPDE